MLINTVYSFHFFVELKITTEFNGKKNQILFSDLFASKSVVSFIAL